MTEASSSGRRSTARYLRLVAALALFVAGIIPAHAQVAGGASRGLSGPTVTLQAPISTAPMLLDAPISRKDYLLGPGDVVDLSVFGEINQLHQLVVTPEGTLVVPAVGVTNVLGLNLDQAQARVRESMSRYFQNIGIHLTLSRIRQFKVFVLGDTESPGVQVASAATRVSEVIPADTLRQILPRNILLRRGSGDTVRVDLVRFRQLGDMSANPTLREGDALLIPAVDETVRVFGRVAYPGTYEHRPGETLADLLAVVNGGRRFPADAADSLRLSRIEGRDRLRTYTFSQADALGAIGRAMVLAPFDALYVPSVSDYKQQHTATVLGQVVNPGAYPVDPDSTTVRDLVRLAGGFAPDASLTGATLQRQRQLASERMLRQLRSVPPELLSSSERRILQASSREDETNVVIDFERLFSEGEDAFDQPVRGGDTLSIPRQRDEITIVGAVLQPGVVQHVPGYRAADFVRLAGGFSRKADPGDAVVVKAGSGSRIDASEVRSIDPGDMIVVPFRERRNYLQMLQTTSGVVTTVSGLVLTVLALTRL